MKKGEDSKEVESTEDLIKRAEAILDNSEEELALIDDIKNKVNSLLLLVIFS